MIEAEVLFNPNAGRVRARHVTKDGLIRLLREHGISADLRLTDGIPEAVRTFADVGPGRVFVVAGGDGTIFQAVQSAVCRRAPVGLMPLGTANDLARSLGIPSDLDEAAEVIAGGHIRRIDLGLAAGRTFIQAAGAGFHAEAFRVYGEPKRHDRLRALRAFLSAFIRWEPAPVRLTVDGVTSEHVVTQVTVANTPVYGPGIVIAPDEAVDDGMLDLVILGRLTRWQILRLAARSAKGRAVEAENLIRVAARVVEIESIGAGPIWVHADGASVCCTPVHIEVIPSCLSLIVPG